VKVRRIVGIACAVAMVAAAPLVGAVRADALTTWQGTVDWNDQRQVIDGFGGSTAFGMADKVMSFPTTERNQILDALFSPTSGAGLSIIRNEIPIIKSTILSPYSFTADAGQASFVDAAKLRATQKLMATSWSPPGWMKSNNNVNGGGSVLPLFYDSYADYLAEYALRYQSRGTPIDYISPANEPDAATSYPSSVWTGDQFRDFTKNNLAPKFTSRGVTAGYMLAENSYWGEDLAVSSLNDPAAAARVNVVAGHGYSRMTNPQPLALAQAKGKKVWQTEMSTLGATNDPGIGDALVEAKRIHDWLTVANANAWNHWWLATDKANTREALIDLTMTNPPTYSVNKRLWGMGNFARFVRPGWVRIGATAGDVPVTAFKNTATGQLAVVAINAGSTSKIVNLTLNGVSVASVTPYTTSSTQDLGAGTAISTTGGVLNATLGGSTITTFVGTGTTTSPLAAIVAEAGGYTGQSAATTAKVINGGASTVSGTVAITAPSGVTPTPASASFGPLAPGASASIPVSLAISGSATPGTPVLQAQASLTGGTGTVTGLNLLRIYDTGLTVTPNTGAELPFLLDAGSSQLNGPIDEGNARFMDGSSTAVYKIQLPTNVSGGTIDLDIGNSFVVDSSTNGTTWTNRLTQTPAVTDNSNRAYRSIDVNTARAGGTVVYLRIGDSFPADGWGGWLAHLRLSLTR
jgi:glucuronoarabinoxylan endo-1,4-beta-xylanase